MNYDKDSFLAGLSVGLSLRRPVKESPRHCIMFWADTEFSIGFVGRNARNGMIEYSTDGETWDEWGDLGPGIHSCGKRVMLRGSGNTHLCDSNTSSIQGFFFLNVEGNGTVDVSCAGNIETLLDWETVRDGDHPMMDSWCFHNLFSRSTLRTAPRLPAPSVPYGGYNGMFSECPKLVSPPALPATTLGTLCYNNMFLWCTSLKKLPALPATALPSYCYQDMFLGCSALSLYSIRTAEHPHEFRIPKNGIGTEGIGSLDNMFYGVGGDGIETPDINTVYYTDYTPVS